MKNTESQVMNRQLTDGSVGSHLVKLSVPMLCNVFMIVALNLTDTYFVAQLGTNELAAMSFTFPVVTTLASLAIGLADGAGAVIALAIGEGRRNKVQRLTTDSLILSLVIGIIFTVVSLATITPLFTALGAEANILSLIRDYMEIWYLGFIFLIVPSMAMNAIRAVGDVKVLTLIMMAATVINFVLDPLLVFGWGIFPRLEIAGAALATIIAQATTLVTAAIFLYRERMIRFTTLKFQPLLKSWKSILYLGVPSAAKNMVTPISIGIITSTIAIYGPEAIAGFGIASRLEALALIAFLALSAAIGPIVGQNWGAKQFKRVNRAFSLSLRFCLIWGVLIAIVFGFASPFLASMFNHNREVISIAATYMAIVPISYAATGIILVSSSTFIALGKPLPSFAMTTAQTLLVYVPLAKLGSQLFGINGIFAAACLANIIVGLVAIAWSRKTWQMEGSSNTKINRAF
jgi:putative MATE family efflux protein